ncbi:hypothetical protein QA645_32450 [Bradyrhizobium sp. CIAT3101]|nr:hypothetical protein [Bradyrhizobium sp. CIAT3101]WFU85575.1 hypothetical protein QA645_32450 [Bradyrhizobium sp. CIAT3101]
MAGADPLPRRRAPRARHQPGRERHPASLPDQEKCALRRSRNRGRKLGLARVDRRHLQAQRRQPGCLHRRNTRGDHRRPSS